MSKKAYRAPRNDDERLAEARAAIRRLEASMNGGANNINHYGEVGRRHREAIAGWQRKIDEILARNKKTED